jgi:cytochrome c oxidase assembly protein subunit 15
VPAGSSEVPQISEVRPARSRWGHRLALITGGATLVLIVAGGLVTNTGAALAVPDWPTTFGRSMFLYPWSAMVGGIFYEHSHRLLGALVGGLTLGLAAVLWLTEPRRWVRWLGLAAVALVCLQGLLGGLRVLLLREALAIVHGCLAQAFFALTVALAVVTSPGWTASPDAPPARPPSALAAAAVATLYLQIVLGAFATHAGWIGLHLAGAAVVAAVTGALAVRVLGRPHPPLALAGPARMLAALLVVQVALGLGAYVARFTGTAVPGGAAAGLALPVTHRVVASLLLGAALAMALHAWRLGRVGAAPRSMPAGVVVSPGVAA